MTREEEIKRIAENRNQAVSCQKCGQPVLPKLNDPARVELLCQQHFDEKWAAAYKRAIAEVGERLANS